MQAMPFVPGVAHGTLTDAIDSAGAEHVLRIDYADLERLDARPAGLVVVGGAPLSHPMSQLQGLGIPTVIASRRQASELSPGAAVRLDGSSGELRALAGGGEVEHPDRSGLRPGEAIRTRDGARVELRASIIGLQGAREAVEVGAAAVGMVRTEYLTPPRAGLPDVAFYRDALGALCAAAAPLPITLRLLDVSVDKRPPWMAEVSGVAGLLGMQGARLFGVEPVRSVVRAQAIAIAELAEHFDLRVLLPYVASPEEYHHWCEELAPLLPASVPLGIMAETPAAALAMPEWRQHAGPVSIGCNDLMQCLFGADRDIPEVAGYLDPYSPTLFRFLRTVARQADGERERVQLCGLLQQLPGVLPLLLGLGFRRFSMAPRLIPALARVVEAADMRTVEQLAGSVCDASDAGTVRRLLGLDVDTRPPLPWSRI